MDAIAFTLGQEIHNHKVEYILYKPIWDKFLYPKLDMSFVNWKSVKYLTDDGTKFHQDVTKIPKDVGGLYLFYIKCQTLRGITEYPFYIGRAQLTLGQNLRKRVKEYFQKFSKEDERPKIYRMFKLWGNQLHVAYFPIAKNNKIVHLERDIINSLLLPMNDLIPNKRIKQAVAAFK